MAAPESTHEELEKWGEAQVPLPRIAIKFCVHCKWNLRAAYYAQELLSTFSTALGEVSLIPATGGTFTITLLHRAARKNPTSTTSGETDTNPAAVTEVLLWDRKTDGGFPETKELKSRVRNVVEPGRDLGHVDRSLKKAAAEAAARATVTATATATATAAGAKAEPRAGSPGSLTTSLESSDGGAGGGGGSTNSPVQRDIGTGDTDARNQAETCEDCQ